MPSSETLYLLFRFEYRMICHPIQRAPKLPVVPVHGVKPAILDDIFAQLLQLIQRQRADKHARFITSRHLKSVEEKQVVGYHIDRLGSARSQPLLGPDLCLLQVKDILLPLQLHGLCTSPLSLHHIKILSNRRPLGFPFLAPPTNLFNLLLPFAVPHGVRGRRVVLDRLARLHILLNLLPPYEPFADLLVVKRVVRVPIAVLAAGGLGAVFPQMLGYFLCELGRTVLRVVLPFPTR